MTTSLDILEGLNLPQQEAVQTTNGPLLIIEGPGRGKTRVITHRIAYLIRVCGVNPHQIAAVTFTNKAAREMRDRLQFMVIRDGDSLTVGTFHSFCAAMLRRNGDFLHGRPEHPGVVFRDQDGDTKDPGRLDQFRSRRDNPSAIKHFPGKTFPGK